MSETDPDGGLIFKTTEDALAPPPQAPDAEPSYPAFDDLMKGICEFVVTWCNDKLAPRDARISKLEAEVETLLTLLGAARDTKQANVMARGAARIDDDSVIDLPRGFLRRVHHG